MAESTKATEAAETPAVEESNKREFIEYLGEEPYGVTFLTSHTLPRGDGLWKRAGVTVNRDLTWERDPNLASIGHKGNRMLLPVEGLPDGAAEALEKLPQYKRVTD